MGEEEKKYFYIGDKYYWASGTSMSSLYAEDGDRSDWGKIEIELRKGNKVILEPANDELIRAADELLTSFQNQNKEREK